MQIIFKCKFFKRKLYIVNFSENYYFIRLIYNRYDEFDISIFLEIKHFIMLKEICIILLSII